MSAVLRNVAELELLVGQARAPKLAVDPVAATELLQKLAVTIGSSASGIIREYQRRCEDALADILLRGTAPPVLFLYPVVFFYIEWYSPLSAEGGRDSRCSCSMP